MHRKLLALLAASLLATTALAADAPLVTAEVLQKRSAAADPSLVILDVRTPAEFAAGHVPGAINITSDTLSSHLKKLPKGREVIAYCRGPYCLLSVDAVAMLREKGYRARRMEDGFPEWKASGLPVESQSATAD